MNPVDAARQIASSFDDAAIPYAIGGAVALGAWGAPRATKDLDLSAFVALDTLATVFDALERAGVMLDRAAAAKDVARIAMFKGNLARMIIDVFVSEHPQYEDMKRRRQQIAGLWFLSPEDLCLHKLLFGRPQDALDLERLITVRPELDLAYVRGWLDRMAPAGDRRFAILDALEQRRGSPP